MPYARYLEIDWDAQMSKGLFGQLKEFAFGTIKMRMGMFASKSVPSGGNCIGTEIAAGRYVTTIHRGAYHKVDKTYRRVFDWAQANGERLADSSMEHYIDDPTQMELAEVRTRIWIALED